ncbi:hypothetical protein A33M_0387 [Rhodovulum sp. PH10]|nr:hypothetical protein A33M_0387 [Rhodovulum sp. PH10]
MPAIARPRGARDAAIGAQIASHGLVDRRRPERWNGGVRKRGLEQRHGTRPRGKRPSRPRVSDSPDASRRKR